jgi:hypothetical protein
MALSFVGSATARGCEHSWRWCNEKYVCVRLVSLCKVQAHLLISQDHRCDRLSPKRNRRDRFSEIEGYFPRFPLPRYRMGDVLFQPVLFSLHSIDATKALWTSSSLPLHHRQQLSLLWNYMSLVEYAAFPFDGNFKNLCHKLLLNCLRTFHLITFLDVSIAEPPTRPLVSLFLIRHRKSPCAEGVIHTPRLFSLVGAALENFPARK